MFQQTQLFSNNPFGVLTAIVAPAILTNACSVLALGTSNRIARVVDRTRVVYGELARTEPGTAGHGEWLEQLAALRTRGKMLLRALRLVYAALGLFAASALVSVGGSVATYYGIKLLFEIAAGLAVITGASAVIGLVTGCTLMVHETSRGAEPDQRRAVLDTRPGFRTKLAKRIKGVLSAWAVDKSF